MAIEIVDFPIKHGGSFHCYVNVHQRVNYDKLTVLSPAALHKRHMTSSRSWHGDSSPARLARRGLLDACCLLILYTSRVIKSTFVRLDDMDIGSSSHLPSGKLT